MTQNITSLLKLAVEGSENGTHALRNSGLIIQEWRDARLPLNHEILDPFIGIYDQGDESLILANGFQNSEIVKLDDFFKVSFRKACQNLIVFLERL